MSKNNIFMAGFLLLFVGFILVRTQDSNQTLRIVGLVCIIASAGIFGTQIGQRKDKK